MSKKRIFIAVNPPLQIKKLISNYYKEWPELPIRWTPIENIHITVLFIGYVQEEFIKDIIRICQQVAQEINPFEIYLSKISYGPPNNKLPRMIWLSGKTPQKLILLSGKIREGLLKESAFKYWKPEEKSYHLHLTLGRLKMFEFRQMDFIPEINKKVSFKFKVNSFEIMESNLKKSGPEYKIIQQIELKNKI